MKPEFDYNYKSYNIPIYFSLLYIIGSLSFMIAFHFFVKFGIWWINNKISSKYMEEDISYFIEKIIAIGVFIIIFLIFCVLVIFMILYLTTLTNKIYRGKGLYKLYGITSFISFIIGIIILVVFRKSFTFLKSLYIFVQSLVPYIFSYVIKDFINKYSCEICNLIGSVNITVDQENSLGIYDKFHNEGGYHEDVTTKGSINHQNSSIENYDVSLTTKVYVPKTAVYDGKYEKIEITYKHICSVCGKVHYSSEIKEQKIS